MSSIAYVTDKNMIEYHRLNGNTTMNFWRLSNQKNFTDFKQGDLLFFYAKGSERKKEKGLVGYGKYDALHKLSLKQMWKRYEHLNGYATKEELESAIKKVSKDKQVPDHMNCIFLKDVVFFAYPIYLSDLGLNISKKVESYFYLDKENPQATSLILNQAQKEGVDVWTAALSEDESIHDSFEEENIRYQVSKILEINSEPYNHEREKSKAKKLAKIKCTEGFELVKGSLYECMKYEDKVVTIAIPFIYNSKDYSLKIQRVLGHMGIYKMLLKKEYGDSIQIQFELLYETEVPELMQVLLAGINNDEL